MRELEPQHLVEEDLAIEVVVAEAVGAWVEFFVVLQALDAERIEIGVEVAADAVGADQHQRVDRVACGLLHVGGGEFDARALRPGAHLVAELLFGFGPLPVERRERFVAIGE